jgi:hypothetical protein
MPSILSTRLDESREERLARHLAWCDLLHRGRLAAAAELGAPRMLPPYLRLVAPIAGSIPESVTLRWPAGPRSNP